MPEGFVQLTEEMQCRKFVMRQPYRNSAGSYSYGFVEQFNKDKMKFLSHNVIQPFDIPYTDQQFIPNQPAENMYAAIGVRRNSQKSTCVVDERKIDASRQSPGSIDSESGGESSSREQDPTGLKFVNGALSKTNLYISGLGPETKDADLRAMCESFGNIISTKAIMDKDTNQCKGYGFVDFDSAEAANKAVNALKNAKIQAQMAKQQQQDPSNLYLANLPGFWNESQLEKLVSQFGAVISTRIMKDSANSSRGVGFARMESHTVCEKIIAEFNGKSLPDMPPNQTLIVKFADSAKPKKLINNDALIGDNRSRIVEQFFSPFIHNAPQLQMASPNQNFPSPLLSNQTPLLPVNSASIVHGTPTAFMSPTAGTMCRQNLMTTPLNWVPQIGSFSVPYAPMQQYVHSPSIELFNSLMTQFSQQLSLTSTGGSPGSSLPTSPMVYQHVPFGYSSPVTSCDGAYSSPVYGSPSTVTSSYSNPGSFLANQNQPAVINGFFSHPPQTTATSTAVGPPFILPYVPHQQQSVGPPLISHFYNNPVPPNALEPTIIDGFLASNVDPSVSVD